MDITNKIRQCIDFQSIYALEEEFNKVGLTVQTTPSNRVVLCKIVEGKPFAKQVIDDYIFIGSLDHSLMELSDRTASKIVDFINNSRGTPAKIIDVPRSWRNGLKMYEQNIAIMNEDVNVAVEQTLLE